MNIINKYPPNIDEIEKVFPYIKQNKYVVFSYGSDLCNPNNCNISEDLMVHEQTHEKQQEEIGIKIWWEKYLEDEGFRLSQEVEAYQNQYQYALDNYTRQLRKTILNKITADLSGSLYGNLITKEEAIKLIKNAS